MNPREYDAMYRAEDTLWWYVGMRRIAEALLADRVPAGARILDAGCGTGGNLVWLRRYGAPAGVDISPIALQFCGRRGLRDIVRGSVSQLPFAEQTFDLVVSLDVIYHLDVHDDSAALGEIRRVLRPGGLALVRVPAIERLRGSHDAAVHTRQRYDLAELGEKVRRAGLEVIRLTGANMLLLPVAAAARLVRRRDGSATDATSDVRAVPRPIDMAFRAALFTEAMFVSRFDLPVGLSAMALARRPVTPT